MGLTERPQEIIFWRAATEDSTGGKNKQGRATALIGSGEEKQLQENVGGYRESSSGAAAQWEELLWAGKVVSAGRKQIRGSRGETILSLHDLATGFYFPIEHGLV